jgi:large subunit ribosomal protein L25
MEKINIQSISREEAGKEVAKKLRREGFIPAIIYSKDINMPIKLPRTQIKLLRAHHFSESTLIEISVENSKQKKPLTVVLKGVQFHPLTEEVIHIDFLRVSMTEKIKVKVPLVVKGEAKGVKEGGVLEQMLWDLEIESLPLDIPEKFEVDISALEIGSSLHVKDIQIPEKIHVINAPSETILTVVAKVEEEVEEEVAPEVEAEPAQPEVIKEKKPTEEES